MTNNEHADDIVRITHANSAIEANMIKSALENEGIECKVVGDMLEGGLGHVSGMLPEIWVHKADAGRAQQILEDHVALTKTQELDDEDDEDEDTSSQHIT
ncbi:MAG: DUF2007 domain-containing protein [Gemmataceae bacterium]